MNNIKGFSSFKKIEPILKGWSSDTKYYIETSGGKKLLLRIADISLYDQKKTEFELMKQVSVLGVPMSQPLDFGLYQNEENVYSLFTWCEGEDAETALPKLAESKQYELGVESGRMLKKIHSISAPKEQEDWSIRFNQKTSDKIERYNACGIRFDGDDNIINYIENNRYMLLDRPQCYHHGDYHVGNMIISPDNTLSIIDFNRSDFGDPWEEFNRIVWSATLSPHFATGQLDGYFGGKPPIEFFNLLAFYISSNTLSSIYWAITYGENQILTMKNQAKDILYWFDNMENTIPTWYVGEK